MTKTRVRSIAGLRADCGMTQTDLADKMGVTKQTIINWEKDQKNLKGEHYIKLNELFGVSVDDLLGTN